MQTARGALFAVFNEQLQCMFYVSNKRIKKQIETEEFLKKYLEP